MSIFAMAQTCSSHIPEENLKKAYEYIKEAKTKHNADMLVFPEYFMAIYPKEFSRSQKLKNAQTFDGEFVSKMREYAKEFKIWLSFGMNELQKDDIYNTTVIVDDCGEVAGFYRKTHLFDAFNYKESDTFKKGDEYMKPIDTPFGKLGVMVCFDVRFPEVARHYALSGAQIILCPSAFVKGENKLLHWQTLTRARAIENCCFVVATDHVSDSTFLGHSTAFSPDGITLAEGFDKEGIFSFEIPKE